MWLRRCFADKCVINLLVCREFRKKIFHLFLAVIYYLGVFKVGLGSSYF